MFGVIRGGWKCRFLANIFILRKMQISSVYHNYFGLLNIGALLQRSVFLGPTAHIQDMEKAGLTLTLHSLFDN
jgi:hypothetical protein